jgi:DNA invertase Pin-like site-specific DNA recombinase
VDVETAKETGRSGFAGMLDYLKRNRTKGRIILVEKTDRLYRNLKDWSTLDEFGVNLHFVKEGSVIGPDSRSNDQFVHGIKVLMARNYSLNLGEETVKGMTEKARAGIWPSCAPFGYVNVDGPNNKRVITPHPKDGATTASRAWWIIPARSTS